MSFLHIVSCLTVFCLLSAPCILDVPLPFLNALELKSIDLRFKTRGGQRPSNQIVIAGIEAKGIEAFGRWPWPRSVFAQLIVQLREMGAKTIAFDLLFPDPEENRIVPALTSLIKNYKELGLSTKEFQNQIFLDEMNELIAGSDNDRLMEDAMAWADNVTLGFAFEPGQAPKKIPTDHIAKACYEGRDIKVISSKPNQKLLPPIKAFGDQAKGLGFVNVFPDTDGIIRRVKPMIPYENKAFMPLAISAASHFLGDTPKIDDQGNIHLKDVFIPGTDKVLLNFYGLENSFEMYSIADIIQGIVPPERLKDKLIIIGGMATGLGDIWATPLTAEIPGLFIQATFMDNILQNHFIRIPKFKNLIQVGCIFTMVLITFGLTITLSPLISTLTGLAAMVAYWAGTQYLFQSHLLIWPLVLPLAAAGLTLSVLLVLNLIIEGKQHQWIKKSFSQYLSRDVIDMLVKEPEQLKLGGEEKELTVLMADIRNFTTLSEKMGPKDLTHLLNLYLGELTDVILKNGGTLDKYMGDAIMAFFGAPVHDPNHPSQACQTAIDMFERLYEKRAQWVSQGLPDLRIGIGINSGPMVVGNLGSSQRFDYSVIGDHVNLASRLEGLSKVYGVKTLISEYTRDLIKKTSLVCREMDTVRVKGKQKPVRIFELLGKDYFTNNTYTFVDSFEEGLKLYREKSFEKAIVFFNKTLALKPEDKPSQLFVKRCRTLAQHPPTEDWDGTWTFTQK